MKKIYTDAGTFKQRICVYDHQTKERFIEHLEGSNTNNLLEYKALQKGIKYAQDVYKGEKIQVFSDSKLIVEQINGNFRTNDNTLFYEMFKCRDLIIPGTEILWVPRRFNEAGKILQEMYLSER